MGNISALRRRVFYRGALGERVHMISLYFFPIILIIMVPLFYFERIRIWRKYFMGDKLSIEEVFLFNFVGWTSEKLNLLAQKFIISRSMLSRKRKLWCYLNKHCMFVNVGGFIGKKTMVEKVAELLLYLGTEVNARQIVYYRYDECNDTFTPEFGGGENFDAEKSGLIAGDNASGLRNFLTWQNIFFTSGKVDEKK